MARKSMSKHERALRAVRSAASVLLSSGDGSTGQLHALELGIAWIDALLSSGSAHGVLALSDGERELVALGLRNAIWCENETALNVARAHYLVGGGYFVGDYPKLLKLHEAVGRDNNRVGIPAVAQCEQRINQWQDIIKRLEAAKGKTT